MSTSSNTKALLQTLLWRQQGNIGGRLGKLVIYIHNVMRPIQIFASHVITLMWGFLEPKKTSFSPEMSHFCFESIFYFDKTFDEKWKFKSSFPNWWWAIEFEKHLKKVWNTCFYLLFLLKFSNFLVGKPPFLQTCVIIHLSWVFFLSEWDEIRKSTLGFSFCRDLIISRVFLFTGNLIVSYIFSGYFLDLILRLLRNLYHFFELLVIKPPISIVHLRNQTEHITFIYFF